MRFLFWLILTISVVNVSVSRGPVKNQHGSAWSADDGIVLLFKLSTKDAAL